MADLQMKIGDCLKRTWDYDSAIEEFRNARIRYQDGFGYFHATTGKTFSKMADIYLKQQNFDAALASYSKAYSIYEEVFGKDHKASVETLQDIRLVTVKEMEYLREQERVRAAKTGRKKSTNGKHPL